MLAHALRTSFFFLDHIALDIPEADITNFSLTEKQINQYHPEIVINCAAATDVTKIEQEPHFAMLVNGEGVKNLAILCKKYNCQLVHYSTDFVFQGDQNIVYTEEMIPHPVNKYGLSKLRGEEYIREFNSKSLIIRLSWLYGPEGKNFVAQIFPLIGEKKIIRVVADQYGKFTYTFDVADVTQKLLLAKCSGIYHFANEGVISRYEMATKIQELLFKQSIPQHIIIPTKAIDYADHTPRPRWSILGTEKISKAIDIKIRGWQTTLEDFIRSAAF